MNFLPEFLRREQSPIVNGGLDEEEFNELEAEPLIEPVEMIQPVGKLISHVNTSLITTAQLAGIETPAGTRTHKPIRHLDVVNAVIETLGFRHRNAIRDEYAVDKTGMKMFGVMDLEEEFAGCRFSIGLRNANDKSMRLALTIGYRVFVCDNIVSEETSRRS